MADIKSVKKSSSQTANILIARYFTTEIKIYLSLMFVIAQDCGAFKVE